MNWHDYFSYDEATGNLVWKERPREHFATDRGHVTFNRTWPGKVAGRKQRKPKGKPSHVAIGMNVKGRKRVTVLAHRVIWEMFRGGIPDGMVPDHIDRNGWNNRLHNLRLATAEQNARNQGVASNNQIGIKGVRFDSTWGKYIARIMVSGKSVYLGGYDTKGLAALAYAKAALRHHGQFAAL